MLFAAGVLFLAVASASPAPPASKKTAAAPADQYFGPLRDSPLSVRTRIDKLAVAYRDGKKSDRDVIHDGAELETALRLWRHAYPRDPWLPPTAYHLAQLYAQLPTAEARKHATSMLRYVDANFGGSRYGHDARLRLASGFPALQSAGRVDADAPTPAPATSAPPIASPSAAATAAQ